MKIPAIAGIDYSMTSPSITIFSPSEDGEKFTFEKCVTFFFNDTKKYRGEFCQRRVYGHDIDNGFYTHEIERFAMLADKVLAILEGFNVKEVALENYAYSATGRVFHIAENTGILKFKLLEMGYLLHTYEPTVIKKFATGKGNAKKEQMYESFHKETGVNLVHELGSTSKKIGSPISDIVDSYFIAKFHYYGGVLPN